MVGSTDLEALRARLEGMLGDLAEGTTHRTLASKCRLLGLPQPPDEGTKYERVSKSFADLPDAGLAKVAEKILEHGDLNATTRNGIQDLLWAGQGSPQIPKRTRRGLSRSLDVEDLVLYPDRFISALETLWILDDDAVEFWGGVNNESPRNRIARHFIRFRDWSVEELFEELGAFEAGDTRFGYFLELLVAPDVVPDESVQRHIVDALNPHLWAIGIEMRETGTADGYPTFKIASTRSHRTGRPKNLIFASNVKPDIRIRDAVNNDIEIVSNADQVLVYDRPIGTQGIRWRDLQLWWKETRGHSNDSDAKSTLYYRLLSSLPNTSPPQRDLYVFYHEIFSRSIQDLPALLPEVWLHWDPLTVKQRGADALLGFRMDFLLLLPHGERVVIEVDGKHHYAKGNRADPEKYASTMRADRDLKLSGYEVFRFGAADLTEENAARRTVQQFFEDLFRLFRVSTS